MKILLATDGSPCSEADVSEICTSRWPADSHVKVLSVAHTHVPEAADPFLLTTAYHVEAMEKAHERAIEIAEAAAKRIRETAPDLQVEVAVLEGFPKKHIVEEAERWGADLVVLGSHGYGPVKRSFVGSVSHAVALHAPCSVEIVRCRQSASV